MKLLDKAWFRVMLISIAFAASLLNDPSVGRKWKDVYNTQVAQYMPFNN